MANKKGTCTCCGRDMTIIARGYCGACYKREVTDKKEKIAGTTWPKVEYIKVYTTSDGQEHGNEVEALRHQLDIERNRGKRWKP